jgi:hypothetical protein
VTTPAFPRHARIIDAPDRHGQRADRRRAHFTVFTLNALRTLAVMEPQVGQRA